MNSFFPSRRPGFTIAELLVVVGVTLVLLGLLLPALSSARESARSTQCLSNQRQIGLAMGVYAQDDKTNSFPSWTVYNAPYSQPWLWFAILSHYRYVPPAESLASVFMCPAGIPEPASAVLGEGYWTTPPSQTAVIGRRYIEDKNTGRAYACNYAANGNSNGSWYDPAFTWGRHSFNWAFPMGPANTGLPNDAPRPVQLIPRPAELLLTFDGLYGNADVATRFSLRHGNQTACNVLYVDGHVRTVSQRLLPFWGPVPLANYDTLANYNRRLGFAIIIDNPYR